MSYYERWPPYVPVAERRKQAEKTAAKAVKAGKGFMPVAPFNGAIGKTFWGKAWCKNLESYSDLSNRLPRGRSYARNGSVIDLKISEGAVQAQVMGSSLYQIAAHHAGPQWAVHAKFHTHPHGLRTECAQDRHLEPAQSALMACHWAFGTALILTAIWYRLEPMT